MAAKLCLPTASILLKKVRKSKFLGIPLRRRSYRFESGVFDPYGKGRRRMSKLTIVGLGEVLWDVFPTHKQLGGAPANFAYISSLLGEEGVVASLSLIHISEPTRPY